MATFTNQRSNETVESNLTNEEACAWVVKTAPANSWLWFWIHKLAVEAVAAAAEPAPKRSFVADAFVVALGYGLKRPMIRVHYKDRRFKLYMSRKGTICLKSGRLMPGTHDPVGDEEYVGCSYKGKFQPAERGRYAHIVGQPRVYRPLQEVEVEFLRELAADPVAFLAACSKDMDRCCYCYQPLEDVRSKAVGYGQTCAKRWGLPWGEAKADENVPSFAKSWDENASHIIAMVRDNPQDPVGWNVLGDWLEEKGLPRCKQPQWDTVLPRS